MSQIIKKRLNIDKLNNLEDVKRLFSYLDIQVTYDVDAEPSGFNNVKDLFE